MKLDELFLDIAQRDTAWPEDANVAVRGITADSRLVWPDMVFAALQGEKTHGAIFIDKAITQGARAVLTDQDIELPALPVPLFRAANPRRVLALAARRLHPQQPKTVVAVTGTSGKSSVAEFTRQLFAALGHRAASLGTIGVVKPDGAVYGSLTTPDPVTLHQTLESLTREDGISHLAFEASSHGLDQHRLDGVTLAAGAFLNLGRDHLDYHPTVEAYLAAKMRLFTEVLPVGATAVINADGAEAHAVIAACRVRGLRVMTTGRAGDALRLNSAETKGFQQYLTLDADGQTHSVVLPLVGTYQIENALVAAALVMATGARAADVIPHLAHLKGVKGRLEVVGTVNGGLAIVDYAHKPDALEAVLTALRPFAEGKLISVFGCGGDRDRGKRPLMGAISTRLADVTIITDDNPRSEVPEAIRAEILKAAPGAREVGDRRAAIAAAVELLGPGDVAVIAGKGHETGQIVGGTVLPFSDHDEVASAIHHVTRGAP